MDTTMKNVHIIFVCFSGWVTAIATTAEDPNMILTASRDKVSVDGNVSLIFQQLI
jgi:hypothetical protein